MLDFDPVGHRYSLSGVTVPSVTQILDWAGDISPFCRDELAAERGTRVHEACALMAWGKLDLSTVDPRIMGYVMSFAKFLGMVDKWKLVETEGRVYSPWGYAGTFDLLFDAVLLDLKTSVAAAKWHCLQTAAYHNAGKLAPYCKRAALYLNKDGDSPKYVEHKDRTDFPEFLERVKKYHEGQ